MGVVTGPLEGIAVEAGVDERHCEFVVGGEGEEREGEEGTSFGDGWFEVWRRCERLD